MQSKSDELHAAQQAAHVCNLRIKSQDSSQGLAAIQGMPSLEATMGPMAGRMFQLQRAYGKGVCGDHAELMCAENNLKMQFHELYVDRAGRVPRICVREKGAMHQRRW